MVSELMKVYRCTYQTFPYWTGDMPGYLVEEVDNTSGVYDLGFIEFTYRVMKGITLIAVMASTSEPTLEQFRDEASTRLGHHMHQIPETFPDDEE